jgi:hypothetical protein
MAARILRSARGRAFLLALLAFAAAVAAAKAGAADGGLDMFAHGYEGEGPGIGTVRASSLDFYLRKHGYAWVASGYRSRGYRPEWFLAEFCASRARHQGIWRAALDDHSRPIDGWPYCDRVPRTRWVRRAITRPWGVSSTTW